MSRRHRLGRVTGTLDLPRGPDVVHRIRVPGAWLDEGAAIEIELPRNLACAKCKGGGCDACGRSGAITLRGRGEPTEIVQVTLPKRDDSAELTASGRGIVLRVPERGGLSDSTELPRGILMLTVISSDTADSGVARVAPATLEAAVGDRVSRVPASPPKSRAVLIVAILVALWILGLIVLRALGYG